jgi:hypothetical protein
MARRSCPLECFEQCDTVPDELNDLNRRLLALRILGDPISSICLVNHGLLNIASRVVERWKMCALLLLFAARRNINAAKQFTPA